MQSVQLYIGETRLDLFEDETIVLTQSIQNVRDIDKVFTDFSQTFSVPASRQNNKSFKHYYNYDIDNGFDARKKSPSTIELNGKKFRDGKIRLDGVELKKGVAYSYKITFFGNTVSLKDLLGEDNLASLDWLSDNFTLDYDSNTVLQALQSGASRIVTVDGIDYKIIAPLITHTKRLIYDSNRPAEVGSGNLYPTDSVLQGVPYTELKYALPIKAIVKAIENSGYGLKFSTHFFNEENLAYSDLYMWLHRKRGEVFDFSDVIHQVDGWTPEFTRQNEVSVYQDKVSISNSLNGLEYTLSVLNNATEPFTVIIKKDGDVFAQTTSVNGEVATINGFLTNSSSGYTVFIQTNNEISVQTTWSIKNSQYPNGTPYTAPYQLISLTRSFIITEQIPDIKIIDFLTGLFKMFNLTAYEENGIIQVKTLDEYYSPTSAVDASSTLITSDNAIITADIESEVIPLREITEYIDVESSTVDVALPFKEINLEYEGLGTKLAKRHNQISNRGWGTGDYDGGSKYDASKSVYKVVAPFEHLKYERLLDYDDVTQTTVQFGWFVDDNDSAYLGKPLLFYPVLIGDDESATNIRFLTETSYFDITQYTIPSNSLSIDSTVSKDNVNFNIELNEYTYSNDFTDTLFEKYYKTYITDLFDSKLRISKYKAYFDLRFLINYKLSDRVQILDRIYRINSINTNLQTGESELELLNIGSFESVIQGVICTADTTLISADTINTTADLACNNNTTTTTSTSTTSTTSTTQPTTTTTEGTTTTTTAGTTTTTTAGTTTTGGTTTTSPTTTTTTTEEPCVQRITYSQIPPQTINVGQSVNINLDNFFTHLDGLPLFYNPGFTSPYIQSATINGSIMTVTANNDNNCGYSPQLYALAYDGQPGSCSNVGFIDHTVTGCATTTSTTSTSTTSTTSTSTTSTTTTKGTTTTQGTTTTTTTTLAPSPNPTGSINNTYVGYESTGANFDVFTSNAYETYIDVIITSVHGLTYSERQLVPNINGQTLNWGISWDGDINTRKGGSGVANLILENNLGTEFSVDNSSFVIPVTQSYDFTVAAGTFQTAQPECGNTTIRRDYGYRPSQYGALSSNVWALNANYTIGEFFFREYLGGCGTYYKVYLTLNGNGTPPTITSIYFQSGVTIGSPSSITESPSGVWNYVWNVSSGSPFYNNQVTEITINL